MDYKAHLNGVGAIVTNLQAVETVLRRFLVSRFGQCPKFPEPGAQTACRSYLTAYVSLGGLIADYHNVLTEQEQNFRIDESIVSLRDALAHGRLVVRGKEPPYELWKFGKSSGSKTDVDFFAVLTEEWLKEKWLLVEAQQKKVINCSKARGYGAF